MVPDRLPEALREIIAKFPPGSLQFEVGVQTFDEATAARISRRQNYQKLEENFRWLRANSGVHIHADLIAGLPGETLESFGAGFDRLIALGPQEIQVGILKRLRGTPITRHDDEWQMIYSAHPPYEILRNKTLGFLRRIAPHHKVTLYAAGVRADVPPGVEIVHVPALRGRAYATILSFPAAFASVRRRHDSINTRADNGAKLGLN